MQDEGALVVDVKEETDTKEYLMILKSMAPLYDHNESCYNCRKNEIV